MVLKILRWSETDKVDCYSDIGNIDTPVVHDCTDFGSGLWQTMSQKSCGTMNMGVSILACVRGNNCKQC